MLRHVIQTLLYLENIFFGKARQALTNKTELIEQDLTQLALNNKAGISIARLGLPLPYLHRNLVVIVPKTSQDLKFLLTEIEKQKDGRSIMNAFAKMMGETLTNNTGSIAMRDREKLVPYSGDYSGFMATGRPIITAALKKWSDSNTSFILLDEIKLLLRRISTKKMIGDPIFSRYENAMVNLGFKYIKQKLLHPFSIVIAWQFNKAKTTYKKVSRNFVAKHWKTIEIGLRQPKTNVFADLAQEKAQATCPYKKKQVIHKHLEKAMLITGFMDGVYINLVSILLQLIKYPEMIVKLRHELESVLPTHSSGYQTLDDKKLNLKLPYLECIIKEGLRFTSSAPILPRYTSQGVQTQTFNIPRHSNILINMEAMHHDKNFWGGDADQFRPERFLEKEINEFHDNNFMPFSTGSRQCPGFRVGLGMLRLIISELFLNYDLIAVANQESPIVDKQSALVMDIGPGYRVFLKKRAVNMVLGT